MPAIVANETQDLQMRAAHVTDEVSIPNKGGLIEGGLYFDDVTLSPELFIYTAMIISQPEFLI